jgi:hypothetical protein
MPCTSMIAMARDGAAGRAPNRDSTAYRKNNARALSAHLQLNRSNLHRYIRISDIMLSRGLGGGELPFRIFKRLSAWLEAHEPTMPTTGSPNDYAAHPWA